MSLALDAMGGDHAPAEIVRGALAAAPLLRMPLLLVGHPDRLRPHLPADLPKNVEIVPATQEVGMEEKPTDAYRKKKDSSLLVCARLVKEGRAGAMVSAGNTGAASAFALLTWRQMDGIDRPAIAAHLPNRHGGFVLLDAGANPDADPEHLVQYAHMGRAYARLLFGRPDPRVHLLNIGEEPGKGNAFAKHGFELLSPFPWFAGNIEGKGMYADPCDVVVCDGFVGNAVLKASEGIAEMILGTIRERVPTGPAKMLYWPVKRALGPLRQQMDYSEYGGSPLLGLNGLCIIAHGRSNAKAIKNALLLGQKMVEGRLTETIREAVA